MKKPVLDTSPPKPARKVAKAPKNDRQGAENLDDEPIPRGLEHFHWGTDKGDLDDDIPF